MCKNREANPLPLTEGYFYLIICAASQEYGIRKENDAMTLCKANPSQEIKRDFSRSEVHDLLGTH